jgi:seryl-tRNA synthetase
MPEIFQRDIDLLRKLLRKNSELLHEAELKREDSDAAVQATRQLVDEIRRTRKQQSYPLPEV